MKTNKSYTKRLKLTKKGKVVQRKPGIGHFNAKESRASHMKRHKTQEFKIGGKNLNRFMPFSKNK